MLFNEFCLSHYLFSHCQRALWVIMRVKEAKDVHFIVQSQWVQMVPHGAEERVMDVSSWCENETTAVERWPAVSHSALCVKVLFYFMFEPQLINLYMFMILMSHIQFWIKVLRFGNKDERILEISFCHSRITEIVMCMKLSGILFGCHIGSWHFSYATFLCLLRLVYL